jgi:hypothetical protein
MAFVKIKKAGKGILSIPSGSLESYLRSGWRLLNAQEDDLVEKPTNNKASETKAQDERSAASEDSSTSSTGDEWDEVEAEEQADEKSVDNMSLQELQKKAKELGINTKNLNTVGALRKAIKRA